MPQPTVTDIADMIQVEVRDDDVIELFATQNAFDIWPDNLRFGAAVPIRFTRIEQQRLAGWADDQRRITLADVDVVDFKIARRPGAGAAYAGVAVAGALGRVGGGGQRP